MIDARIEQHPLQPFLPINAKILMLGSFPPPKNKWQMDFYYPNYQNDMWRIMGLIFFQNKNHFLNLEDKNFKRNDIEQFLIDQGIAIFDTASAVIREKENASDKFLTVVEPSNLFALLNKIPNCNTIMTTGDKATETLMHHFPDNTQKPTLNLSSQVNFAHRTLSLFRLPSSSRAYPLALEKKAAAYRIFFEKIGMLS
ncbi:MAG: uracil-DNA glycosylase family protein [Acinetobacter sp.]